MLERPDLLLLLMILPAMMGVFAWRTRARTAALRRIGDAAVIASLAAPVSPGRRRLKSGLWLLTVALVIIALARPVWSVDAEIVETRGVAVMIVLDVSNSMDAQDVLPTRLERAKLAIRDLLAGAEGNLFGLILFAGDAFVQFPLTGDLDSALTFVNAASTGSISRQGTAISDALRLGLATFDERISSSSIIVLLTDGENHEGDPLAVAEEAAARGIPIHVLGYGTPAGDTIPILDANGNTTGFRTDQGGNLVVTKLEEPILQEIAAATGGIYRQVSATGVEVVDVQNRIAEVETALLAERFQTRPVPRFALFVLLALIALTVEMVLSELKRDA